MAAVEAGILPPGKNAWFFSDPQIAGRSGVCVSSFRRGRLPGSTAGRRPAASPLTTSTAALVKRRS